MSKHTADDWQRNDGRPLSAADRLLVQLVSAEQLLDGRTVLVLNRESATALTSILETYDTPKGACEGIPTEHLQPGAVKALIDACGNLLATFSNDRAPLDVVELSAVYAVRDALAPFKGTT